jgi:hypothetical protein
VSKCEGDLESLNKGFAATVFEDTPTGRVFVRVFIGMSVRVL